MVFPGEHDHVVRRTRGSQLFSSQPAVSSVEGKRPAQRHLELVGQSSHCPTHNPKTSVAFADVVKHCRLNEVKAGRFYRSDRGTARKAMTLVDSRLLFEHGDPSRVGQP